MRAFIESETFGNWRTLCEMRFKNHHGIRIRKWMCVCQCGKTYFHNPWNLINGDSTSCSSCRKGTFKHGHAKGQKATSTYSCWCDMKRRCLNPSRKAFKYYGDRGIKVCERWNEFKNFLEDMGEKPKGLTLERINNDGNYDPENCRWATTKEQARNTRRTRIFKYKGKDQCLTDWSIAFDIDWSTLGSYLKNHSFEEAYEYYSKRKGGVK